MSALAAALEIADLLNSSPLSELIEKIKTHNAECETSGFCPLLETKISDGVVLRFKNWCPCHV